LHYTAGVVELALAAAARLVSWCVGLLVFAECWSFPGLEAPLGNQSAQSNTIV